MRTLIIIGVGVLSTIYVSYPIVRNTVLANEFKTHHQEALIELELLNNDKEELEYLVAQLEDEEYLTKVARHTLNLSKKGEIIINLPEPEKDKEELLGLDVRLPSIDKETTR